jgi:hypothetical protein
MITGLRVADAAQQGVAADGLVARLRLALAPAAERLYVGQASSPCSFWRARFVHRLT